ncbi:UPF0182 family protein [Nocardioides panaciterrulae]|uniref:UPF0182 protein BJZ21_001137 n=1 Tax=Nocardioides panaciterrulae TaxID=661492 RepID=A0A7Y9E4R9_9ACTN|nr:UPF0182 family protein [Nocardioides panaciterrulae]NYD41054.1 hypothetical protein [Nocardioides panaciterrulae]
MSELFDEDPRDTPPPTRSRPGRSRALVITAVAVVLAFFVLTTFAGWYTDRLWYRSVGFGGVFTKLFWTKTGLFLFFGVLMAVVVGANMALAYRMRPLFRPSSPEQTGLDRYREVVTPIRTWLLVGVSVVVGLFAGSSALGQWRHYLLWRHGVPFGSNDHFFHKDIGFYVFDLPWLHYLVNFVMAATVVALLTAAVVHYLYGGVRLQTAHDRLSGAAQGQLSLLLGVFVLAKAADYYLDRFDLVTGGGGLITGMTYTDDQAVWPAKNILMFIALICAVLFFLNVWRRTWVLPSVGLALLALSAVLLGLIWPGIVQQFQVKPSEADKEAPYIDTNIRATREAYGIQDVKPQVYSSRASAASARLADLESQTSTVPLVDPHLVRDTFEQNQQIRAYYSVADVLDVDRYRIQGVDRALVLGVRELDQNGINAGDRNWSNLHTVYTHGNGIIAAFANQRPASNSSESTDIQWAEGQAQHDLGQYESRVYFGEQSPDYSIVGKQPGQPDVELDLGNTASGSAQDDTTTYTGKGGVSVGGFVNKLMYAIKFGDPNFLLSERVNSDSKVLYDRNPRDRVERVAPWLTVDSDPYPAVVDGRIQWILDGYTTTDRYPSSESESFSTMTDDSLQNNTGLRTIPTDEINYMRNAVKATVDAYDGTVHLYAWDQTDPILRAWESAFPGTVEPKAAIPPALMDHLRYPEDLFKVQRYQFARYHVTDAKDFYQGNNRWEVPEDPNVRGHLQPPYRMFVDQPTGKNGAPQSVFSLTSVFTPYQKNNLAAFVSVDSDATDPQDYGHFRVLQMPDQQTPGPGLIANQFTSNSEVANELAQFNRSGGETIPGNLLTLPIKDGLIYVEPVYAVRAGSSSSYPILQYVLTSYGGETGIGRTLGESLADALGVTGGSTGTTQGGGNTGSQGGGKTGNGGKQGGSAPTGTAEQRIRGLLDRADRAFRQADAALSRHDPVTYAKKVEQARNLIAQAVALANQQKN